MENEIKTGDVVILKSMQFERVIRQFFNVGTISGNIANISWYNSVSGLVETTKVNVEVLVKYKN